MTADAKQTLAYFDQQQRKFRQEMRDIRAAQLRWVRRQKRLTDEEFLAECESDRQAVFARGIPYYYVPKRLKLTEGAGI